MVEHDLRYDRAQEHLKICLALWDSVEPGAIMLDRSKGIFGDPSKVHLLNYDGEYYKVRGPLPAMRSPQGRPVIIQAGISGPGMDLAAHYADLQFSTRRTLASMKEHRSRLDERLIAFGRDPRACGILWSVRVQVAQSASAAKAMEESYIDSIPPEAGLIELSSMYGMDFSRFPLDIRMADLADEVKAQNVHWGSFEEILRTTDPQLTLGEYGRRFMTDRVLVAAGTPQEIVDKLEQWHFETGANGGFMLARGFSAPGNLQEFVDHVVPELQRRNLTKKAYAGKTLKENLSL
jgi:alkanesulfonate monooxygenase SsuD/methylene tetrahydromethanopterin reductase-like flavin-dependent oxidoreductase (luciferase family)